MSTHLEDVVDQEMWKSDEAIPVPPLVRSRDQSIRRRLKCGWENSVVPDVPSLGAGGVREGATGTAVRPIPAVDVVEQSVSGMSESSRDANMLVLAHYSVLAVGVVLHAKVIRQLAVAVEGSSLVR